MTYLIGIIVIIFVLSLVFKMIKAIFECICNGIKSASGVIIIVLLCIAAYYEYHWKGVLIVAVAGLIVYILSKHVGSALVEHDEKRKAIAQMKRQTSQQNRAHANELALQKELDKNCRKLGEMTHEKWNNQLSNYKNKQYETNFDQLVDNFSKQMEEQFITHNSDWFTPFLEKIANGEECSITQFLYEVKCPELQITHSTPNMVLIERELEKLCKDTSEGVRAILRKVKTPGSEIYCLTKYGEKLYGPKKSESTKVHHVEIEDDDI